MLRSPLLYFFSRARASGGSARRRGGRPLPGSQPSPSGVDFVGWLCLIIIVIIARCWRLLLLSFRRGWGYGLGDVRCALVRDVAQQFDQEPGVESLERLVLEQMLAVVEHRLEARSLELLGAVLVGRGEDGEQAGVQRRGLWGRIISVAFNSQMWKRMSHMHFVAQVRLALVE